MEGSRALGQPVEVSGFVLPLAVSTFKLVAPVTWLMSVLFLAKLYGVTITTGASITIVLSAVALSFATPGVPQGAQLVLAPILVTYGIPPAGIALLIAADTIPDLFATMANVTGDFVAGAVIARHGLTGPALDIADTAEESASSGDA